MSICNFIYKFIVRIEVIILGSYYVIYHMYLLEYRKYSHIEKHSQLMINVVIYCKEIFSLHLFGGYALIYDKYYYCSTKCFLSAAFVTNNFSF